MTDPTSPITRIRSALGPSGTRGILVDVAFVLGAIALWQAFDVSAEMLDTSIFVDLGVYRMGGRGLLDGAPLYDLSYEVSGLPFTYTPFAAIVFAPFAALDKGPAEAVWLAITCAALLRACWLAAHEIRRRTSGEWPIALLAFTLAIGAFALEPVRANLSFGQINVVIVWLVLEDVLRRRPSRAGGVLLGAATGIKLIPGLFIVLLLVTKRTREAVVAAIATAATIAVGFVFQPAQAWLYWTGLAYDSARVGGVAYVSNQSINGVITRFTQPGGNRILWILLSLVVVAASLWAARRLWDHDAKLPAVAVVAIATLLVSPISWSHHWVWLVIVIAALLDPAVGTRAVRLTAVAVTFATASSYVIWQVPNTGDQEYAHTLGQRIIANAYAWEAVLLLALFCWAAHALGRPEDTAGPAVLPDESARLDLRKSVGADASRPRTSG